MARARSKQRQTDSNTPTQRMGTMAVKELDQNAIAELLKTSRTRGSYDLALKSFLESESPGIEVDLDEGEFSGKQSTSIMTGFKGAMKRHAEKNNGDEPPVRLIQNEGHVYLVRTDGGS